MMAFRGDPNRPRGTHVRFNDNDGALVVVEGGIADDDIGHFGIGAWEYTAERPDQVTATKNVHSRGFYFLADRSLYKEGDMDISAFGRLGFAAGNVEQFRSNASVGLVLSGYVPQRPDGQIGFAVTRAENSDKYETSNAPVDSAETQFELTYSDRLMPWLSIQPDLQYTINPGTDPALKNAWTAGLRVGIDF